MAIKGNIQRVKIEISASGAGTSDIVDGVAGECIHVLSVCLTSELDANLNVRSAATNLTGIIYIAARGGFVYGHEPFGIWSTMPGETLGIYRAATGNIGGSIIYVQGPL